MGDICWLRYWVGPFSSGTENPPGWWRWKMFCWTNFCEQTIFVDCVLSRIYAIIFLGELKMFRGLVCSFALVWGWVLMGLSAAFSLSMGWFWGFCFSTGDFAKLHIYLIAICLRVDCVQLKHSFCIFMLPSVFHIQINLKRLKCVNHYRIQCI